MIHNWYLSHAFPITGVGFKEADLKIPELFSTFTHFLSYFHVDLCVLPIINYFILQRILISWLRIEHMVYIKCFLNICEKAKPFWNFVGI